MFNAKVLIKGWIYQTAITNFKHYEVFKIEPPVELSKIIKEETIEVFEKNKKTLKEDFGIKVSDKQIVTFPVFLKQIPPYPEGIGNLVRNLAEILSTVHPDDILAKKILSVLSEYYSNFFEIYCNSDQAKGNKMDIISNIYRAFMWENIRQSMYVTEEIIKGMRRLVATEQLYTIFERC